MGTRGAYGFISSGKNYVMYNHWDSYPEGLGLDVVRFIEDRMDDLPSLRAEVENLTAVSDDVPATQEEIDKLQELGTADFSVNAGEGWYALLRNTQGNLDKTLEAGLYEDASDFLNSPLWCEYAYLIDLDSETLRCYSGLSAYRNGEETVRLVASIPFERLGEESLTGAFGEGDEE